MAAETQKQPSLYQSRSCGSSRVTYLDRSEALQRLHRDAQRLVRERPDVLEVRLFGSLARGDAVPGSDADILIVLCDHPLTRWFDRIPEFAPFFADVGLPVELFPYTHQELAQAGNSPGMLAAARQGLLLAQHT